GFQLAIGLLHVGVVGSLLFLLEGVRGGRLFGAGLLAGGEKLLERAAGHVAVLHEPVGKNVIGMANHAACCVGKIADVAVFNEQALAGANVGEAGGKVLGCDAAGGKGDKEDTKN